MFQMAVPIEPCFIVPLMVQSQSQDLWVELMLPRRAAGRAWCRPHLVLVQPSRALKVTGVLGGSLVSSAAYFEDKCTQQAVSPLR